jgi:hypothetical protein
MRRWFSARAVEMSCHVVRVAGSRVAHSVISATTLSVIREIVSFEIDAP